MDRTHRRMSPFAFFGRLCPCFRRSAAHRQQLHRRDAAYERVPGVRHVVVLNPNQGWDPIPHAKVMARIKEGLEVKANTWADLEAEVSAWLDRTEESVFHDRVLLIDDETASAGEHGGGERWRLGGIWGSTQKDIPIESARQCFVMRRRVPQQALYFILLTEFA